MYKTEIKSILISCLEWSSHRQSGTIAIICLAALVMACYFIGRKFWQYLAPSPEHDKEKLPSSSF